MKATERTLEQGKALVRAIEALETIEATGRAVMLSSGSEGSDGVHKPGYGNDE